MPETPWGLPERSISEGFSTSLRPSFSMQKTPISFVEPCLFLTALKILYEVWLSPSKYNTVSTMCSKTFGPAIAPSLLTWPIIKVVISSDFASFKSAFVHSLTWETLPGIEEDSGLLMVWIESIIKMSGWVNSASAQINSMFVSVIKKRFSFSTLSLEARILICLFDSSPETYRIFKSLFIYLQICKSSVDFPIPGVPPKSESEPLTIPPPKTLSSSLKPVLNLVSSFMSTLFIAIWVTLDWVIFGFRRDFFPAGETSETVSSFIVFPWPQEGHIPFHLLELKPHSEQTKTLFDFFIMLTSFTFLIYLF